MPKKTNESIVDRFIRDARNYATSKQLLEEAKLSGRLTARDKLQIELLQPCTTNKEIDTVQTPE